MSDTLKKLLDAGIISQDDINKAAAVTSIPPKKNLNSYPGLVAAHKARQANADRRRELIAGILKENPKAKGTAIADVFGVSKKTVYEDIKAVKARQVSNFVTLPPAV